MSKIVKVLKDGIKTILEASKISVEAANFAADQLCQKIKRTQESSGSSPLVITEEVQSNPALEK